MSLKDLNQSNIQRQNILNNNIAIEKISKYIDFTGIYFQEEYKYTKQMIATFYGVDERTIDRYLEKFRDELKTNGYVLVKGKSLKELKSTFSHVINVASKTIQIGLVNFRTFLNIGMLLVESENAKILRSRILDIAIKTINEKNGCGTKYIIEMMQTIYLQH